MVFAGLKKPQDRADLIVRAPLCRLRRRATAPGRGPPWQRPPDADARAARSLAPAGPPQERDCVSRSLRADRSRHCLDCERCSCRGGRHPRHWPSFFPSANTDFLPVKDSPHWRHLPRVGARAGAATIHQPPIPPPHSHTHRAHTPPSPPPCPPCPLGAAAASNLKFGERVRAQRVQKNLAPAPAVATPQLPPR